MATLSETASWTAGIYQLETTDPVLGGPDGIDNLQAKQLANRTLWLKEQVETLGSGKQPMDATLSALSGITTAADQIIYTTGIDSFAVNPLTAFIRTLLDDADQGTARNTLGAAPLASPVFSGTPTAPTAAPGTNTQQLATTAFVRNAISARLQRFTSSGSFTVPPGITTVYISGCAGGGGGGFSSPTTSNVSGGGGGGGAGQSIIRVPFAVTPGQVISVTIGAGGGSGSNGGDTTVGALVTLSGGSGGGGGTAGSPGSAAGGLGGSGYPRGADGSDGNTTAGTGNGGQGASSPFGGGGGGSRSSFGPPVLAGIGVGQAGVFGSGGGGAGGVTANSTQSGGLGGTGAPGLVIFEW
ncbi:glycine-rich domain-containing protein [Pseudomonas nicosulfuronedens]